MTCTYVTMSQHVSFAHHRVHRPRHTSKDFVDAHRSTLDAP